ncbi:MAG: hypothetical protein ABEH43_06730, partial [Flavobacteriales bacterium]
VKIPMFVSYSQSRVTPQFDPLAPDIKFDKSISDLEGEVLKQKRQKSEKFTLRRSINFTNVRKKRTGKGNPHFYDFSNFSFNYSYDESMYRDINIKFDRQRKWRAGVNYNFSNDPTKVTPLKNVDFFSENKALGMFEGITFFLGPKQINFNST